SDEGTKMKPKSSLKKSVKAPAEQVVKDIRRATRRHFSAEDKIRIVLEGLRGDDSIAELCRKEGIAQSLYYTWSKEFMEAGKRRLAGDTARAATTGEVQDLRREARALKESVADLTLENRLLKKSMIADGGDDECGIPHPRSSGSFGTVKNRTCPPGRRWITSALPAGPSTAGMIVTGKAGRKRWRIALRRRAGCGTASARISGTRSSRWRWRRPISARANWPCDLPMNANTLCPKPRSTVCSRPMT